MTQSTSARAGAIRRMRRRTATVATDRFFCSTNGCASFLELDPSTGIATCPICGYRRRTN